MTTVLCPLLTQKAISKKVCTAYKNNNCETKVTEETCNNFEKACDEARKQGVVLPKLASVMSKKQVTDAAAPSTASLAPADGLRAVGAALTVLEPMVTSGDFEGARNLLRRPLFASFLGYTPGVRGNAGSLKPAAALAQASTSTAALAELLLDLKRIDDFCLSNRVIVFNAEDLEQVNRLMAEPTQKPEDRFDLDEVRSFIADAREHIGEALAALR